VEPLVVQTPSGQVVIAPSDLSLRAVRASGPGGQNVNKVASKVELRFSLEQCAALPPAVKTRLRTRARGRLDADGRLLITSQRTRDQLQNLRDAREKLAELIAAAWLPPKPRTPTKPTRGSKRRRLDDKRKQAQKKQARGRVRRED
jgi:ribosome-associated protein